MNALSLVSEDGSNESSSGSNRPRSSSQPSPFLTKTYDLVDDPSTDQVVSWCQESSSFVIWDPRTFSMSVLPKYFKHNNFSNFVRQLNSYGFKKMNPDRWEFANASFIKGQRHLMTNNMKRKTTQYTCPKFEETEFNKEINKLRKDRQLLMSELVNLRQLQKSTRSQIRSMEQRLRKTELKQQQTTLFLSKAVRNPEFLQRLCRTRDTMSGGGECGISGVCSVTENELEVLDFEMEMEMSDVVTNREKEGQDELVGEFLNDWIKEELRIVNVEDDDEHHVHVNMFF